MLPEIAASCPYCGETIILLVDASGGDTDYIEDCAVCCQPIRVTVAVATDEELPHVSLCAEQI